MRKKRLASILSVSERTVRDWLSRMDNDAKEARDRRIFDLWLACWTQQEIAEETGIDQGDLSKLAHNFMEIGTLAKNHEAAADHATDFDAPIYKIWKQHEKSNGSAHFITSPFSATICNAWPRIYPCLSPAWVINAWNGNCVACAKNIRTRNSTSASMRLGSMLPISNTFCDPSICR